MAARVQSNVVLFSYRPEAGESTSTFVDAIRRGALPKKTNFLGCEVVREGQRSFDTLVCTPTRVSVYGLFSKAKWERKGARGWIADVRHPTGGESATDFLRRWARDISKREKRFGDEKQLFRAHDAYYDRERNRMRARRVSRGTGVTRCKRLSSEEHESRESVGWYSPSGGVLVKQYVSVSWLTRADVVTPLVEEAVAATSVPPTEIPEIDFDLLLRDLGLPTFELDMSCDWASPWNTAWDKQVSLDVNVDANMFTDWYDVPESFVELG